MYGKIPFSTSSLPFLHRKIDFFGLFPLLENKTQFLTFWQKSKENIVDRNMPESQWCKNTKATP